MIATPPDKKSTLQKYIMKKLKKILLQNKKQNINQFIKKIKK